LQQIARQIAAKVTTIDGDLLVDDRLFDRAESTGSGPGRLTPIVVNDNLLDFLVTPGEEGKPAAVDHRPRSIAITVDARIDTVETDKKPAITISTPAPGRFVVRGQIPAGHKPLVRVREIEDPAAHARTLLLEALAQQGVKTRLSPLSVHAADRLPSREVVAKLPVVTELVSPPFSENMKLIMKVSHNLHASTLPLLVAAQAGKRTLEHGLRLEAEHLKKLQVPVESISFGGGAGGARSDLVTPQAAVCLLRHMATRSDFSAYQRALPILGVDGTLAASVGKESPARGKFAAKTGTYTLKNGLTGGDLLTSKALAGYGQTAKGRKVAFAFFVNHVHIPEEGSTKVGRDLGKLCELVYQAP
jgi:D-alanyl-D-alanine carboxypeptidase/D-alanyl-D-alanine-endopeptidase (penicillin-binding protein 4)